MMVGSGRGIVEGSAVGSGVGTGVAESSTIDAVVA